MQDVIMWVSLIVGVFSVIIALIAIAQAKKSEMRSKNNFDNTNKLIETFKSDMKIEEERIQNFLKQLDEKTARIESISSETKADVHENIKRVFESSFPSQEQQTQNNLMQMLAPLLSNPDALKTIMELTQKKPK